MAFGNRDRGKETIRRLRKTCIVVDLHRAERLVRAHGLTEPFVHDKADRVIDAVPIYSAFIAVVYPFCLG